MSQLGSTFSFDHKLAWVALEGCCEISPHTKQAQFSTAKTPEGNITHHSRPPPPPPSPDTPASGALHCWWVQLLGICSAQGCQMLFLGRMGETPLSPKWAWQKPCKDPTEHLLPSGTFLRHFPTGEGGSWWEERKGRNPWSIQSNDN